MAKGNKRKSLKSFDSILLTELSNGSKIPTKFLISQQS